MTLLVSGKVQSPSALVGLNFSESDQYISRMPSKRVPSPEEVMKVRRSKSADHSISLQSVAFRLVTFHLADVYGRNK